MITPPSRSTQTQVKVLGIGCRSCRDTYALVEDVARTAGVAISLERVDDPQQFVAYGVMRPPAVVVDGRLVHAGGRPARNKVERWFQQGPTA